MSLSLSNLDKLQICSRIKYYLLSIINISLGEIDKKAYYIHGGNIQFELLDFNMIKKIKSILIKMYDNPNLNKNQLEDLDLMASVIFSEDYDIVSNKDTAKRIARAISQKTYQHKLISIYLQYVLCIVCSFKKLNINDYDIFIKKKPNIEIKPQNIRLFPIILLIKQKNNGPNNFELEFADCNGIDNFKYHDKNTISGIIDDLLIVKNAIKNKDYVSKIEKRVFRMLFFLDMVSQGYVNKCITKGNISLDSNTIDNMNELYNFLQSKVKKINKTYFRIIDNGEIRFEKRGNIAIPTNILIATQNLCYIDRIDFWKNGMVKENNYSYSLGTESYSEFKVNVQIKDEAFRNSARIKSRAYLKNSEKVRRDNHTLDDSLNKFTGIFYGPMNDTIIQKIYYLPETTDRMIGDTFYSHSQLMEFNNDVYSYAKAYQEVNDELLGDNGFILVYRYENFINTGPYGSYYDLDIGSVFIIPTTYSTTINVLLPDTNMMKKKVLMKIRLNKGSPFIPTLTSSAVGSEMEITLPLGTILQIDNTTNMVNEDNLERILVEATVIGLIGVQNMDEYIHLFRRYINGFIDEIPMANDHSVFLNRIIHQEGSFHSIVDENTDIINILSNISENHFVDISTDVISDLIVTNTTDLNPNIDNQMKKITTTPISAFCQKRLKDYNEEIDSSKRLTIVSFDLDNSNVQCQNNKIDFVWDLINNKVNPDIFLLQNITPAGGNLPSNKPEYKVVENNRVLVVYTSLNVIDNTTIILPAGGIAQMIVLKLGENYVIYVYNVIINDFDTTTSDVDIKYLFNRVEGNLFVIGGNFGQHFVLKNYFEKIEQMDAVYGKPSDTNISGTSQNIIITSGSLDSVVKNSQNDHNLTIDYPVTRYLPVITSIQLILNTTVSFNMLNIDLYGKLSFLSESIILSHYSSSIAGDKIIRIQFGKGKYIPQKIDIVVVNDKYSAPQEYPYHMYLPIFNGDVIPKYWLVFERLILTLRERGYSLVGPVDKGGFIQYLHPYENIKHKTNQILN